MDKLSKNIVVPLYYQLAELLRSKISSGEYTLGQQLPSERELMSTFSISRNTVRDAIDVLVQEGLGRTGSRAGDICRAAEIEIGAFADDELFRGYARAKPASVLELLKLEVVFPPDAVAERLQVEGGEKVLYVKRCALQTTCPWRSTFRIFPGFISDPGK